MIDSHTHTVFSYDGKQTMRALFSAAEKKGVDYLATTEHVDLQTTFEDYQRLDYTEYYRQFLQLKQEFRIPKLAFGYEFGFQEQLENEFLKVPFLSTADVIINSVHEVDGKDPYYGDFFEGLTKQENYNKYFSAVRRSLEASYPYHVIGHIGYMMRYVPYVDKLPEGDTWDIIDDIFRRAIALDKTIEVNVHIKNTGLGSVPTPSMLRRYRELGGDNVTFSSDAHQTERLVERFSETSELLKTMGFRYYTVYLGGVPQKIKI